MTLSRHRAPSFQFVWEPLTLLLRSTVVKKCFCNCCRLPPITIGHPQGASMPRRIFLSLSLAAAPLFAQSTDPVVHTAADLQQQEAKLIETAKASPTGLAIGRLENYGNDYTLLVVRTHTGDAERHQFWADQIVVNHGDLILVYGGTMLQERP